MVRPVDVGAFDSYHSIRDYDKAALEEARQRYIQAQGLEVQRGRQDILRQKFDMERQQFEVDKAARDAGQFSGNSIQAQIGNRMKAMGYDDNQILQALTMKGIALQDGRYDVYSPTSIIGAPAQRQQAPEPLGQPANTTQQATGIRPDANELINNMQQMSGNQIPSVSSPDMPASPAQMANGVRTIVNPIDPIQRERELEAAKLQAQTEAKLQQTIPGKQRLTDILDQMSNLYTKLDSGGGAINTSNGALDNASAYVSNSGIGQGIGQMFGTENQSIRNQISANVPLISAAIKDATGMSSQQMNSNFELQQYLKALSSPTNDIQANLAILNKLEERFGLGSLNQQSNAPQDIRETPQNVQQSPAQQQSGVINWEDLP